MSTDPSRRFEVRCPCCEATLLVDATTRAVLVHHEKPKPPVIDDLREAAARLKGDAARREQAFEKSFADHRNQRNVLDQKFDELLKRAKDDPDAGPPPRAFDLD